MGCEADTAFAYRRRTEADDYILIIVSLGEEAETMLGR